MSEQKDSKTKSADQKNNLTGRSKIILDISIDGFCVVGLDGRIQEVNSSLCDITGYSKEELVGMKISDIDVQKTPEQIAQQIDKVIRQGYDRFETKNRRKDGKIIDVEVSVQYCDLYEEKFFFNFTRDITEREHLMDRNQKILETSIDGFCVVGPDGRILEVNSSLCDITGYSKEELLNMKITDIEAYETSEQTMQHIDNAMKQGCDRFETKHRRKDGKIIDVEVSSQYCDVDEEKFFFSFFRDITDVKLSTDELKKSEKRYKTLCNNIPGMVYRGRPDWSTEIVSNSETVCGYCPEDVNSKKVKWPDIIHPDDRKKVADEALKLSEKALTRVQKYRIIAKDGGVRWVEDNKTSIFTEEGVFDGVAGVVFDITDRKRAEDELRKFKTIADKANYGAAIVSLDGVIVYVNEYFAAVHGYTPEQLIGKNLTIFHNDKQQKTVLEANQRLKETGSFNAIEIWHTHKDGTEFPMLMNTLIIKDKNNQPLYMAATAIDITEQKQLEAEREIYKDRIFGAQKHACIGSMGAAVAHQVNQPLTKINILLDRAIEEIEEMSCCPSALKNVKEGLAEAQKAAALIRKFRQYSKGPALEGKGKVDVSAVADRIVSILSEKARQAKMRISIKGLRELPELETNGVALEQIFLVIIQNAIEAADGQKAHNLEISGGFSDGNIELQFADDCCGITPENLDRIFEPFFSTKRKDKGMGLGLDIVQQILISFGGQIRVESEVGKGTRFYVTLPVSNTQGI